MEIFYSGTGTVIFIKDWNTAYVSLPHTAAALQNNVPSESSFATKSALVGPKNVCPFQILDLTLSLYASFGQSAYCRNHYGRFSHLREKYGKSPPKILLIFTSRQHNFSPNAFFSVHITQHNGNYRMIPFHWYVLCIGILLCWHANDVMFWGYKAHFGTQKNYATGTYDISSMELKLNVKIY